MKKVLLVIFLIGGCMLTNDFIGQQSSPYNGGWFLPQESQWVYDSAGAPSYVVNIDGNMAGGTNLYNVGTTTPIYIRAVIAYL